MPCLLNRGNLSLAHEYPQSTMNKCWHMNRARKKTQLIHLECENSCMGLNSVRNKTTERKKKIKIHEHT